MPAFCSVTFGAGGSTREGTLSTVLEIRDEGLEGAPHISCIGSTREGIARCSTSTTATASGISSRCAATCPPLGRRGAEFRYANELVAFIREETGDWFHLDVAAYPECHPEARTAAARPRELRAQDRRGRRLGHHAVLLQCRRVLELSRRVRRPRHRRADRARHHADRSFTKLARFSDACGAEIPRWMRRKLEGFGDDAASIRAFGLDVVTQLCASLLERGAPGLHFYTLNQAALTTTIWQRLGL
jgi:methylenetetrahydrofolate reductase (NADPH)